MFLLRHAVSEETQAWGIEKHGEVLNNMKWFTNISVRAKIFSSFIVIIVLAASVGAFIIYSMMQIDAYYADAVTQAKNMTVQINAGYTDEMMSTADQITAASIEALDKIAEESGANAESKLYISLVLFTLAAIISVIIAMVVSGMISKPLVPLAAFMMKAGTTGDISLETGDVETIGKYSLIHDEIGRTIKGASAFIMHVTDIAHKLAVIADGDFTTDNRTLSENDTMGAAINGLIYKMKDMLAEVSASTLQVSAGAKQVADGAQSLAQGSTEQAASIEELSSAMAEIAHKTKENAETAEKASVLSEAIKGDAQKGSMLMKEMIEAVKEIDLASQSIGKIMKTIDDIAFQTNILALNAAVEAARAGQHGKGFAVVAEEVRSLASKSAEAAKDTGEMIQNTMEKAGLGSRIARDTAISLNEIVAGIAESSALISHIAESSNEQSVSINQVFSGIDQVARVMQSSNATVQESAAASEEMSGQSDVLYNLIEQFKIN